MPNYSKSPHSPVSLAYGSNTLASSSKCDTKNSPTLEASSFGGYECNNPKNEIAAMRLEQRKCCGSLEPHPHPTAGLCLLLRWDRLCCSQ